MGQGKPFCISKQVVREAYKKVKANQGAAGVDAKSIEDFEKDLKNNLYRIWNRMSSGTYFPPPVRCVAIPKKDGGTRYLGIPTVSDRIAQAVVKLYLEPVVEPSFHPDSYGYRPKKSALDAVGVARQRCWFHKMQNVAGQIREKDRTEVLKGLQEVYGAPPRRAAVAASLAAAAKKASMISAPPAPITVRSNWSSPVNSVALRMSLTS